MTARFAGFLNATEIDTRMIGMIAALLLIWCAFDIASGILRGNFGGLLGGSFLTPRNLWTLLNQTSSIAVMTTGMVLIIVMRHIDLSVGSMLSLVAVAGAVLQVYQLAPALGVGHPAIWIIAIIAILALGTAIGAFNGYLTAYAQIPAFIVTLGGLIAYSGVAFLLAKGETVAPMDKTFKILGGTIPASWIGPVLDLDTRRSSPALIIVLAIIHGRRQRIRFRFPLRPIWAEATLAALGSFSRSRRSMDRQFLSLAAEACRKLCHRKQHPHSRPVLKTALAMPSAWLATRWCAALKA